MPTGLKRFQQTKQFHFVHLLTNEPAKANLATFLQILKQLISRQLKSSDQKQFWQRRYYEFNVSSVEKYIEKVQYIHRNPVKLGLAIKPEDYRWSSFKHYATGELSPVEIESHWARRSKVAPVVLLFRIIQKV
jgi:putative transposase